MPGSSERCVRDYMHEQLEVVRDDASARTIAGSMRDRRIGAVFVEALDRPHQSCRLAGIVTETDLVARVLGLGQDLDGTTAGQIMSQPILTIAPDRPMIDAGHLMNDHHVRHLGVSEGQEIIGVVSVRDLAKHFMDTPSGAVQALNDVYSPLTVLMTQAIETLDSQKPVAEAARWMAKQRIGSVFVLEAGEIVGIVTESDIVRKTLADGHDPTAVRLRSLLTFPLVGIEVTRSIRDACEAMATHHVRHLAVTDRTKIVGVVSIRDLVKMVTARDRPAFLRRT